MQEVNTKLPELIINAGIYSAASPFTISMPTISVENGPFRYGAIMI